MSLYSAFKEIFQSEPLLVRSPGRINLIGEHTDYNQGLVLPASIDKEIRFAAAKNDLGAIRMHSRDYGQNLIVRLDGIQLQSKKTWANFILGVYQELAQAGHSLGGFDCIFEGDIPLGAGLSSSAALECAVVYALDELFDLKLDPFKMVKIAQAAENNFVGVRCGIMDQFASMFGKNEQVIRLDCRSLEYEYLPFELKSYQIILLDTQVKHSLADSEYNTRRQECEEGLRFLQEKYPNIQSLRDVELECLEEHRFELHDTIYQRCHYVISENQRVIKTQAALQKGDLKEVGQQMYASHQGLSEGYEVSCEELDFLVQEAKTYPWVLGARMMGGGFGGCTINLVKESNSKDYIQAMSRRYKLKFSQELKSYCCQVGPGTSLMD